MASTWYFIRRSNIIDDMKIYSAFSGKIIRIYAGSIAHIKNGLVHKEDGPAVEYYDDHASYFWLNGHCLLPHKWQEEVEKLKASR